MSRSGDGARNRQPRINGQGRSDWKQPEEIVKNVEKAEREKARVEARRLKAAEWD
jgi:hypothetical protein